MPAFYSLGVLSPYVLPVLREMVPLRQNLFRPAWSLGSAGSCHAAVIAALEETMPGREEKAGLQERRATTFQVLVDRIAECMDAGLLRPDDPAEVATTVGAELKLFGSVRDEGLPRAGALVTTWRMLTGPGTVTFSAPDEPRTLASFAAPGAYELELWASDGEREGSNRVAVTVDPAP